MPSILLKVAHHDDLQFVIIEGNGSAAAARVETIY